MSVTRVCSLSELASETATRFDVAGLKLSIIRIEDDVFALADTCSHANFSLSGGDVDADDKTVECTKHGAAFSLTTGEPQCLPATKPVAVHDVEVRDGEVFLIRQASQEGTR